MTDHLNQASLHVLPHTVHELSSIVEHYFTYWRNKNPSPGWSGGGVEVMQLMDRRIRYPSELDV